MKKATQLLPMAMLALALASCNGDDTTKNDTANNETQAKTTPCKRPIDYTPLVLTPTNRTAMGNDIAPNIRYEHDGNIHSYNFGSVDLTFTQLQTIKSKTDSDCTTWPGIKVHYGLDAAQDKFIYIFQPVNLELIDTLQDRDSFNINDKGQNIYYYVDASGTMNEVDISAVQQYMDDYKMFTRLHNTTTGSDDPLDINAHPYAITFPFDELDALISQNEKMLFEKLKDDKEIHTMDDIKNKFSTKGIKFECGAKAVGDYHFHHIMMTPLYVNASPQAPGTLTFNSADLGALCPPNCGRTGIAIISNNEKATHDNE